MGSRRLASGVVFRRIPTDGEFPGSGLVNRGNESVVAVAQNCSSFLPTRRVGWIG